MQSDIMPLPSHLSKKLPLGGLRMERGRHERAWQPGRRGKSEKRRAFVIVCDHASNRIPDDYRSFGYAEDALATHIAWDPGALGVARRLSALLDAPLLWPDVSRRVIDCNRPTDASSLIVSESEGRPVPPNRNLSQ